MHDMGIFEPQLGPVEFGLVARRIDWADKIDHACTLPRKILRTVEECSAVVLFSEIFIHFDRPRRSPHTFVLPSTHAFCARAGLLCAPWRRQASGRIGEQRTRRFPKYLPARRRAKWSRFSLEKPASLKVAQLYSARAPFARAAMYRSFP